MSDVYVAFVRDDQSYAEALAVALQGSGFTVSRSASVVEAIGECAAIVVLWTPAAARSKLFVDAADRAFRSGKMVLARMGSDPLPAMFTGVEAHPLARWSGDPESPDVDPVVFHVDRLVSRARLASGARPQAEDRPQATPRGVVHHFPSGGAATARARPMEQPQPQQRMDSAPRVASPADPLAEEASFWRQIQHSNNPGDFYAYLERYGRQGAFAELAETRIQQLSPRSAPAPAPQPPSYQPSPYPPQQSYQPSPGPVSRGPGPGHGGGHGPGPGPGGFSMQPPVARPMPRPQPQAPAQPRLDPHPARARVEPPAAAPPRESGGGGGMRGLALIVFLTVVGGGGFYIYQQFRGPESAPAPSADSTWEEPVASSNPADDGAAAVAGGDANQIAGGGASRTEPSPTRPTQRASAATPPPVDGPTPEPVFRTLPAATPPPATRAPATVGDPESAAALLRDIAPAPVSVTTPTIQPPATQPAAVARPPSRPRWAQRASGRDLTENYPAAAARRSVEGRVVLDCLIGADLAIRCRATSETPTGYGFAAAALRVAQKYRSAPTMEDGRPAAGERTSIAISFKPAS